MAHRAIRSIQTRTAISFLAQCSIDFSSSVGSTIRRCFLWIHYAVFCYPIHFTQVPIYLYVFLGDGHDVSMDENGGSILCFIAFGAVVFADQRGSCEGFRKHIRVRNEGL